MKNLLTSHSSLFLLVFSFVSCRYHGQQVVDFDSARGGISLETEKTESGTTSRLLLTRAQLRDSGNYTCVPTAAVSASVQVHVLNGKLIHTLYDYYQYQVSTSTIIECRVS